jgi:hypothetical protein
MRARQPAHAEEAYRRATTTYRRGCWCKSSRRHHEEADRVGRLLSCYITHYFLYDVERGMVANSGY